MPRGVADVVQVVVLAAGADAFLRRGGADVGALLLAGEHVLELHHAGVGEHQRGVVARHQRRAFDHLVPVAGEVVEEGGADVVAAGHGGGWGSWMVAIGDEVARGGRSVTPSGSVQLELCCLPKAAIQIAASLDAICGLRERIATFSKPPPCPASIIPGRNPLEPTLHAGVVAESDVEPYPGREVELWVEHSPRGQHQAFASRPFGQCQGVLGSAGKRAHKYMPSAGSANSSTPIRSNVRMVLKRASSSRALNRARYFR